MNNYENLLKEIRDKGVEIESINDLMYINKNYKDLIPILLKYLNIFRKENEKAFIVSCLGVKGFTEATNSLINEFHNSSDNSELKWTIGNTMSLILDKNSEDAMIKIVQKKEHGDSRQMFVIALGKLKSKKALPILLKLINDPDVSGHVIKALSFFDDAHIIPYIEPFTNHKMTWIKKEADKAIKKIKKKCSAVAVARH